MSGMNFMVNRNKLVACLILLTQGLLIVGYDLHISNYAWFGGDSINFIVKPLIPYLFMIVGIFLINWIFLLVISRKDVAIKMNVNSWYACMLFALLSVYVVPYAFGLLTALLVHLCIIVLPLRILFQTKFKSPEHLSGQPQTNGVRLN